MKIKRNEQLFLNKLSKVELNKEELFVLKELKNIERTPCKCTKLKVIDFDNAKEKLIHYYSLQTLSSCDCLKLDSGEYIDFIELKSITKILEFNPDCKDSNDALRKKILKFELSKKIIDSYNLLRRLVEDRRNGFIDEDRFTFDHIKKRYIIVLDLDIVENSREFIFDSFKFLGIKNTIEQAINEQVKGAELMNISNPIMKNCETLREFYN